MVKVNYVGTWNFNCTSLRCAVVFIWNKLMGFRCFPCLRFLFHNKSHFDAKNVPTQLEMCKFQVCRVRCIHLIFRESFLGIMKWENQPCFARVNIYKFLSLRRGINKGRANSATTAFRNFHSSRHFENSALCIKKLDFNWIQGWARARAQKSWNCQFPGGTQLPNKERQRRAGKIICQRGPTLVAFCKSHECGKLRQDSRAES